jgi:hypothetical protein
LSDFSLYAESKNTDIADLVLFHEPTQENSTAAANGAVVKKTAAMETEKRQHRLFGFDWKRRRRPGDRLCFTYRRVARCKISTQTYMLWTKIKAGFSVNN